MKFNYKGPRSLGAQGCRSTIQESLRRQYWPIYRPRRGSRISERLVLETNEEKYIGLIILESMHGRVDQTLTVGWCIIWQMWKGLKRLTFVVCKRYNCLMGSLMDQRNALRTKVMWRCSSLAESTCWQCGRKRSDLVPGVLLILRSFVLLKRQLYGKWVWNEKLRCVFIFVLLRKDIGRQTATRIHDQKA